MSNVEVSKQYWWDKNPPIDIVTDYVGSIACASVNSATLEQLKVRRPYTIGAIEYHKHYQNEGQIKFFTSELELIDKRLKKLSQVI